MKHFGFLLLCLLVTNVCDIFSVNSGILSNYTDFREKFIPSTFGAVAWVIGEMFYWIFKIFIFA